MRTGYRDEDSDFVQAGDLYRLMSEEQKSHLVSNLVGHMKAARKDIQERQVMHFYNADPDYGTRVAKGLGIEIKVPAKSGD